MLCNSASTSKQYNKYEHGEDRYAFTGVCKEYEENLEMLKLLHSSNVITLKAISNKLKIPS